MLFFITLFRARVPPAAVCAVPPPGFLLGQGVFLIARLAALFHVPLGALLGCPKGPPTFGRAITLDRLDDASHRF